jgi:hypothetical protein
MRAAAEKGKPGAFKVPTLRHLMLTGPLRASRRHRYARRCRAALFRARLARR